MNAQEAMDTIKNWMRALKHVKEESGRSWNSIADEAGIRKKTPIMWMEGTSFPNLVTFMTFLDAMGYEIKIVRKGSHG